jgi:pectin methylesterase-like acyl-CoA thioesterase
VKEGDCFYFYTGEAGYLYAASSSKNYLKTGTDCDNNYKAEISISEGNAIITFQGNYSRNIIKYNNAQNNGNLFSCYASTSDMKNVQIYKEVPAVSPVAQIGTQKFETLQAAVDAAQQLGGEQTINLLSDISGETVTIKEVANFKLTIDGQ